jgi:iron complex outermembrane receptor protein
LGLSTSEYRSTYGTVAEPTVSIGLLRRHHVMEGQVREVSSVVQDLKFQLGQTNYTHTEYEGGVAGTRFDNSGHDLRLEARQRPLRLQSGLQLEGTTGLQIERNALQATGDEKFMGPGRTQSAALFTFQTLQTDWGQLNAGARAEHVRVELREDHQSHFAQTQQFNPYSIAFGVLRNMRSGETKNGWQFTSHWNASQRAPKDYELYAEGAHLATHAYEIGDHTLGLEKGMQLDAGADWKQGTHRVAVTGFVSRFSNFLSLIPTGGSHTVNGEVLADYQYQGVRAHFYGVESTAQLRLVGSQDALLSSNGAHGAMDLDMRADLVRAEDLTHNTPLPRIAPMRFGADAVWSRHAWGARWGFMHAAGQSRVPDNGANPGVATASHTLWHAAVNYHTHSGPTHWLLFVKLENITNKLAYSSTSVLTQTMGSNAPPLAGRSLKVGAQVSF